MDSILHLKGFMIVVVLLFLGILTSISYSYAGSAGSNSSGELPAGTYINSCHNCRLGNNDVLHCKCHYEVRGILGPDQKHRNTNLDMSRCNTWRAWNHNGTLKCG